jgi:hypothetical protein
MSDLQLTENIARLTLLLPIILFFTQKSRKYELWVIHLYLLFSLFRQILIQVLSNSDSNAVNIISHLNPLTNFIFIAAYFYYANKSKIDKYFIVLISILYAPTQLLQFIYTLNETSLSIISTINTIIVLGFCMAFYYNLLKNPNITFVYLKPSFWITSALFLFSSGTFFVFWYNQIYNTNENFNQQYVHIHAIIYIIRNFIFSVAFLIKPYKEQVPEFS